MGINDKEKYKVSKKISRINTKEILKKDKLCPICNSKLFYVLWGFARKGCTDFFDREKIRVVLGGCCYCGYDYKCLECDRVFTSDLKELKEFEKDSSRDKVKLSKEEVFKMLELRNIDRNISYKKFIEQTNIVFDYKDESCNHAKERLVFNILHINGIYKENFYDVQCPKCKGKIIAKLIYNKNNKNNKNKDISLYREITDSKNTFVPQYLCVQCNKKFGYEHIDKVE